MVRKSLNDIIEYFNTYANPKMLVTAADYNCFDFMVKPAIQVSPSYIVDILLSQLRNEIQSIDGV